jgi:hypothetical protein
MRVGLVAEAHVNFEREQVETVVLLDVVMGSVPLGRPRTPDLDYQH